MTEDKDHTLRGSSVLAALKEASVGTVITVPDITTSEGLLRPIAADPELRHIPVCKEDEGVGIGSLTWAHINAKSEFARKGSSPVRHWKSMTPRA